MLALEKITKRFGGVTAIDSVTLKIERGELVGLIGPNGAGKTTLLNLINGLYRPDAGKIFFNTQEITQLKPFSIARMGIGRTYQIPRIFRNMTVEENILLPASFDSEHSDLIDRLNEAISITRLQELRNYPAGELSGGQQKLLEIARILVHRPPLLLLDEPFAGVHPELKSTLIEIIKSLHSDGKTVIMVSHDMQTVSMLASRTLAMDSGRIIADGTYPEVSSSPTVIEAYLGAGYARS